MCLDHGRSEREGGWGGRKRLDQMTRTEPFSLASLFLLTPFCGLRYVSIRIEGGPVRDVREDLVPGPASRGTGRSFLAPRVDGFEDSSPSRRDVPFPG